jgi:hypothetical protein
VAQELIRLRARIAALEAACPRSAAIADDEDEALL